MVLKPSMMAETTTRTAPRDNFGGVEGACAFELAEEEATPEQADEGVGVPEGESGGEADVADGEDGEGVGDGPEGSGEDGPDDEVAFGAEIGEDVGGAFEEGGEGPAGGEDAGDHAEGDGEGREAGGDELGGSFGCSEPDGSGETGEDTELVEREVRFGVVSGHRVSGGGRVRGFRRGGRGLGSRTGYR